MGKSMRILRFMGYPINNFSTLERMVLSQAMQLNCLGHHAEVAFDGIQRSDAAQAARQFAPNVQLHFDLPFPSGPASSISSLQYAVAAARLISKGRFNVVHLYFEPSAIILNQLARLFPAVQFVRTIGSTPLPRGNRRYLDRIKQRKWVLDLAQVKRIICVGEHISDMLSTYGVSRERLVVIPNATDVEHFKRRVSRIPSSTFRMVFIGRLEPVKNLELLVHGMEILVHEYRVDVRLTLYGDGRMRTTLEALVLSKNLSAHVCFVGQVANVADILNNDADVYVQASYNEGCAAAVVEAMACEVPVALSAIPGHEQVATPGEHAAYFNPHDPSDFARCILALRENYSNLSEQIERARAHVVDKYSIDIWIKKELAVYSAMVGS